MTRLIVTFKHDPQRKSISFLQTGVQKYYERINRRECPNLLIDFCPLSASCMFQYMFCLHILFKKRRFRIKIYLYKNTYFFSIFYYVAHIAWITTNKKDFGTWRHFDFQHKNLRNCFTAKLSEILHIYHKSNISTIGYFDIINKKY